MTCPVCNDEGTVTILAFDGSRSGDVVMVKRPCSAPSCIVAGVDRLYREMA
jgi:hypothetical protein